LFLRPKAAYRGSSGERLPEVLMCARFDMRELVQRTSLELRVPRMTQCVP